jgi:hypothetical protein
MKTKFYLLMICIISLIVYWVWFFTMGIMTYGDWGFFFNETQKSLISLPYIWLANRSFGDLNISVSFYPVVFLLGILSNVFSYAVSERILYFYPSILVGFIGSFFLIKKIIYTNLAAFIGSIVYTFNIYFLIVRAGHLTLANSFAVAPLILLLFMLLLEERKYFYAVLAGLASFISSYYEFRAFYIIAWVLLLYFFYYIFLQKKEKHLKSLLAVGSLAIIPFVLTILLNTYWLLPFLKSSSLFTNDVFNRSLFGNEFFNMLYAITLFHPFWTGKGASSFILQPIPAYYWLIPFIAFLGLYLERKRKYVSFFGLIALLGILLTKQEGFPFNGLYPWLYKYFPGFNAYREASKFYFLIAIGYSVLIAGFIDWLWKKRLTNKLQILLKYLLTASIVFIFLWNTRPLVTRDVKALFVARNVPEDYILVKNFILQQPGYFRTLWIPDSSRWSIYSNTHPAVGLINIIDSNWNKFFKKYVVDSRTTSAELLIKFMQGVNSEQLLKIASVKYVFIPLADKMNDDNFFDNYAMPRQYYIDGLNRVPYLHKINIGTKDVVVYEIYDFISHISAADDPGLIGNKQNKAVEFDYVSQIQYKFKIKNVAKPFYVNFSDNYHLQWKLRIGDFSWIDALIRKDYFVAEKNHFKNDAGFNSYFVDPKLICRRFSCNKNIDGTYDISGTIYFSSQGYMYVGMIISGATLIAVLGYLLFVFGERLYGKKN